MCANDQFFFYKICALHVCLTGDETEWMHANFQKCIDNYTRVDNI